MTRASIAASWLCLLLAACASGPVPPDWQANAKSAAEDGMAAHLRGDTRQAEAAFARARSEVARTGRPDLMARVELMRCAALVASLDFSPCQGFDRFGADAAPAEQAYAGYLAGRALAPDEQARLPKAQQAPAAAIAQGGTAGVAALQAIEDPMSRLIAAAVLFRAAKADPATIAQATDTASSQGWRRPLLAWLEVQALRAEKAGATDEAARLRRRMSLVTEGR